MLLVSLFANINLTFLNLISGTMASFKSQTRVNFNWIDITEVFKNAAESECFFSFYLY